MTSTLVILGASLMDAGNIASLAPLIGGNPFSDAIYAKGRNVRASDGPVLGEHVVRRMGGDPSSTQLFDVLSMEPAQPVDVHNYAHGGATSGTEPSRSLFGFTVGIGLKFQADMMQQRADFYRDRDDVDVFLSASGNDILSAMDDVDRFTAVIATKRAKDDRRLVRSIARPISRNIRTVVDQITGLVDEIAILGSLPMSVTPRARQSVSDLDRNDGAAVLDLLDSVSVDLHRRLEKAFRRDSSIVVLDGRRLWGDLRSPAFIDDVHPSTRTSRQVAGIAVPILTEAFDSFGFA